MNKTKIEWCDYTVNPIKGYCPMACSYCYARRLYDRFGWDKTIRFDMVELLKTVSHLAQIEKPQRIFVGSTIELFGDWVERRWLQRIMAMVRSLPQHTFIFLTKKPNDLPQGNIVPWPDNAWVGITATDSESLTCSYHYLPQIQAKVKFLSYEPLMGRIVADYRNWVTPPDWLIIGSQTGPGSKNHQPKVEWIDEIEKAAQQAHIPIFEKNNLAKILNRPLIQEFPKEG